MNNKKQTPGRTGKKMLLVAVAAAICFGCHKPKPDPKELKDFDQVNLVANTSEYHPLTIDPTLVNGFGLAWSPNGVAWVNSVGGHVSELYTAEGGRLRGVNIPSPADTVGGFPCGIVFSAGKGFNLSAGNPASFIFTGFDGVLSGWNPASGNNAKRLRAPANASYTGLAIGSSNGRNFVYGANFGQKKIDVWDTAFGRVTMSFTDPSLPADYSPYNIQAVNDVLFVLYAKLDTKENSPTRGKGIAGEGNGYVSIFRTDGSFVSRFTSRGTLNIPWGVTMAPASFLEDQDTGGGYGNKTTTDSKYGNQNPNDPIMLIGNFGDGRINAYTTDGQYIGQLQSRKKPLVIDGLWALSFPPSTANIDPARLYFTAGPDKEADGLFGYLIKR